jgi:hypothetical protein
MLQTEPLQTAIAPIKNLQARVVSRVRHRKSLSVSRHGQRWTEQFGGIYGRMYIRTLPATILARSQEDGTVLYVLYSIIAMAFKHSKPLPPSVGINQSTSSGYLLEKRFRAISLNLWARTMANRADDQTHMCGWCGSRDSTIQGPLDSGALGKIRSTQCSRRIWKYHPKCTKSVQHISYEVRSMEQANTALYSTLVLLKPRVGTTTRLALPKFQFLNPESNLVMSLNLPNSLAAGLGLDHLVKRLGAVRDSNFASVSIFRLLRNPTPRVGLSSAPAACTEPII